MEVVLLGYHEPSPKSFLGLIVSSLFSTHMWEVLDVSLVMHGRC